MEMLTKLLAMASWLESPDNDLLVTAEKDGEKSLLLVADALVNASLLLKKAAEELSDQSPELTSEKLEDLAALADIFDKSNDDFLKKQASVLDEILLTISAPKNALAQAKEKENSRIEELKKKYNLAKDGLDQEKIADSEKAIKDSPAGKVYRPLEAPLSTRTCPDHPGAQVGRVGEHSWQCSLDKKIYNFDIGFETLKGNKVPGGNVESQTPQREEYHTTFDTRESKLGLR